MKAADFNHDLLREHLDYIAETDVRRAAIRLIKHAETHPTLSCAPAMHGVIRTFAYHLDGAFLFAFIFNKSSILFYVRPPALRWASTQNVLDAPDVSKELTLRTNSAGEVTVKIVTDRDADSVNRHLIDRILSANHRVAVPVPLKVVVPMQKVIRRPAALVRQGHLRLFTTSLQARHLLSPGFYDIERLDPANSLDRGYQRVLNTARAKRLGDYLISGQEHHDAFLPTSIFLATDQELDFDTDRNLLEIDLAKVGSFSVVDGQHRLEGLRFAAEKGPEIGDFEVPVNIAVGLSKIAQMCHFLIVNTTQKAVDKAVEQRLIARLTDMIEIEDVPTLPRWIRRVVESGDDAQALRLVDYLNSIPESPWFGKIRMPNTESDDTTVNQKSFVVAVKRYVLAASNPLIGRPIEQQQRIFLNYWKAVAEELGSDEETVLFKSIGVDLFCRFSGAVFGKLQNKNDFKVATIRQLLRQTFDNLDGDFAGAGQPDWWLSGSGPAGGLNAAALAKINHELGRALHRTDTAEELVL
jgi:DGQHR domain-containing protein